MQHFHKAVLLMANKLWNGRSDFSTNKIHIKLSKTLLSEFEATDNLVMENESDLLLQKSQSESNTLLKKQPLSWNFKNEHIELLISRLLHRSGTKMF